MGPRVSSEMALEVYLSPLLGDSVPIVTRLGLDWASPASAGWKVKENNRTLLTQASAGLPIWRFCPCPQCIGYSELSR